MTRFGWSVVLGIVAAVALVLGIFAWRLSLRTAAPPIMQATSTPTINPNTLSIYTSGQYGFSFFYPSDAILTDAYSSTTLSNVSWRVGATGSGTPVARLQKGSEEVRIGLSTDQRELKTCTQVGQAEKFTGPLTISSTTWQTFTFQKIGTDNEQKVTSYRTVHDRTCFAVEEFQPLAGTASGTGYTIGDIITNFSFAD